MIATQTSRALDPMLCFAVYSLERRITRIYQELLAPWSLSYTQYLVVVALADQEAPPTVGRLGEVLGLDSGTLSPLLVRLERRGILVRRRASSDGRLVTLELTDAGRELWSELAEVPRCLQERLPLSHREAVELNDRLRSVDARIAARPPLNPSAPTAAHTETAGTTA